MILFTLLIGGMLLKDIQHVNDVYVLRGIAETLCLGSALLWITQINFVDLIVRYWLFFLYLLALLATLLVASQPAYVLFQVASLAAVFLFGMKMAETGADEALQNRIVAWFLALVCVASLVYVVVAPYDAYLHEVFGPRFRGIVGQPGALGSLAGMLLGLAIFTKGLGRPFRAIAIVAALGCLYLTGSRTFWVASIVGGGATIFFYSKRRFAIIAGGAATAAAIVGFVWLIGFGESVEENFVETARPQSIENLTGRTAIWELATDRFYRQPVLGYGYALAHEAFQNKHSSDLGQVGIWQKDQFTMHSGLFQSLLDSGVVGTSFYLAIIGMAILSMIRYDRARLRPAIFYVLVFLAIGNFGETVIFTAGTVASVYFWYLAVYATSLRYRRETSQPLAQERPVLAH